MSAPTVAVCTVTHNSVLHLAGWWEALTRLHQHLQDETNSQDQAVGLRVIAVDCASDDESLCTLRRLEESNQGPALTVISSPENVGFAGGMNLATGALAANDRWLLSLNPDARPEPESLQHMLAAFTQVRPSTVQDDPHWKVGAVTGRLVRPAETAQSGPGTRTLDACGMAWTRSWRHLDRGSNQPDDGRFGTSEEVFAGTGACTLYLKDALNDVALPPHLTATPNTDQPQVFHQDFHSFREDAELGLRLQRRGWSCVYAADAVVEHQRFNLPERRSEMGAFINYHSLKNRYLLRLLHQSGSNILGTVPAILRDGFIFGYVLLRERSSLAAYSWLWKHRRRLRQQRRWLRSRQSVSDHRINRWFQHAAFPIEVQPARRR